MFIQEHHIIKLKNNFTIILLKLDGIVKQTILPLLLLLSISSWTQEPITKIIGTESGLPSQTIYKIDQDSKGVLWIATDRGICSYNGFEFRDYKSALYKDYSMVYLRIDSQDRIWHLNISGELYYIKDGKVNPIRDNIYDNYPINSFEIKDNKMILFVNHKNKVKVLLYELIDNGIKFIKEINRGKKYGPAITKGSSLYINQYIKNNTLIQEFDSEDNHQSTYRIDDKIIKILTVSNDMFIGKNENKVILINESHVEEISQTVDYDHAEIYDSICWLLSSNGLQALSFIDNKPILETPILTNYKIQSLFKDMEGNFWVGTRNSGLLFIPDINSIVYNTDNSELTSNHVRTLTITKSNKLFIGLDNGKVAHLLDKDISTLKPDFGKEINSIIVDENNIFVASNKFITKANLNTNQTIRLKAAAKAISLRQNKNILLALSNKSIELSKKIKSFEHNFSIENVIDNNRAYAVESDSKNRLWLGTVRGLFLYNSENEFLDTILNYNISDIEIINDSTTFVSTFASGIFRIINLQIDSNFNKSIKLSSNNTSDLYYSKDSLYISTAEGLDIINVLNNKITYLNKNSGLPIKEINASVSEGKFIWVATGKGLYKIPKPKPYSGASKIYIDRVRINQKDTTILNKYKLNKDQRYVNIQFSTPEFSSSDLINFYFRIIGQDTTWQLAYNNKIQISKLPYGKNEIEIFALNINTLSQSNIESIEFNIETPLIYQRWFKVFVLILVISIILTLWTKYISDKHNKEKELLINQRQIDGFKLIALQNHMNPHFISNSLFTIQNLIDKNERWQALTYTSEFADIVRQTMFMTTLERINLSEEIEFLKDYIRLEKARFEYPPECKFIYDNRIINKKSKIKIPPLLIQPIVENVFKHADFSGQNESKLKICFWKTKNYITCEISDNGTGIEEFHIDGFVMKQNSTGLKTVEERLILNAKQLGIKFKNSTFLKFERTPIDNETFTKITLKIYYPEIT